MILRHVISPPEFASIFVFVAFDRQSERCKTGRAVSDQRMATQKPDVKKASELRGKARRKMAIKLKTCAWDASENLDTVGDMAAYLEATLDAGVPALIGAALYDIACAKGMTQIAGDTGLGRESLYKALSPDGKSEFATILQVINSLRLKLCAPTITDVHEIDGV